MWAPNREDANSPTWNKQRMLEGVNWYMAHPLYHPYTCKPKEILEHFKK